MPSVFTRFLVALVLFLSFLYPAAQNASAQSGGDFAPLTPNPQKVPEGVIIVKGAWSSASDTTTPVPEGVGVTGNVMNDPYFGLTYSLPQGWIQKHTPPPPSDSGLYVLAQLVSAPTSPTTTGAAPTASTPAAKEKARGLVIVTAQDIFFTPLPAANALQLVNFSKDHLSSDYQTEIKPTETTIAGRPFVFYAYWSPVAELHWYVVTTQIRCHAVQFVMSSRDTKMLESLFLDMNKMKLPAEAGLTSGTGGGSVPVCIKDYAKDNVIEKVNPLLTERRFNSIPVRIIIDKEGKVKHIHFLSAFPEQSKVITDALKQWRFRPYERDGQRMEVETGIVFGRSQQPVTPQQAAEAPTN
ncbi:MAG TPA: hypothetical protein VKT33_13085 [Candidatus Angelobacter sp.]|nr:hypothetical protein [Candidatus Angelobacter sp.]